MERPADDVPKQLTQLENASKVLGKPAFVVVGIGGNDIQFSDIGVSCVLPGDCRTFIEDLSSSRLASVGDEIERTYAEIRVVVGLDVPVVAVPYPRPIHVGPTCRGVVLSEGDVQVINSFTTSLNDEIETAAQHAGAFFMANVEDGLSDSARQLCEPNDAAGLNFIDLNPRGGGFWTVVNPAQWGHNFVHPNELGHRAINAAATRWLAEHPCLLEPPCPKTDATIDLQRVSLERVDAVDDVSYGYDDKVFLALMEALVFVALASLGWWLVITATIGWKAQPQDVDEKSFAEQIVASIVGWRSDDEIAAAAAGHTLASDTSRDVSDDRAPGRGRRRRRT